MLPTPKRNPLRRTAAVAVSATLVAAGVTVGLGAGVAGAQTPTCAPTSTDTKRDGSTVGVTHNYSKTVNVTEAAAGTTVTYTTVVGTSGIGNPYVDGVTDYPPAGFGAPVEAKVTAFHLIPPGTKTVTVPVVPVGAGFKVSNNVGLGWFVNAGNPLTVEMTYRVPGGVSAGQQITSGGIATSGTVGVGASFPDLTSCFTVRAPNAGETVTGSLEDAGFGSSDGQFFSPGSISEVLGDTISRILQNGS